MSGMRHFDPDDQRQLDFIEWVIKTDIGNTMSPRDLDVTEKELLRDIDGLINFGLISPEVTHHLRGLVQLYAARQLGCWEVEKE